MAKKPKKTVDYKYTLKTKEGGKILLQSIVTFGSKKRPLPEDWETNVWLAMALQDYKQDFIEENFDIEISEDLNFDIGKKKYRFFYHYFKRYNEMSVHFRNTCYRTKNVVCEVPSETKWKPTQPNLVMQGFATEIIVEDDKIIIR